MPIELTCDGCGQRLRVADEHAGKRARCPQCGAIYSIPVPGQSSQPKDEPSLEDTTARPSGPTSDPASGPHPGLEDTQPLRQPAPSDRPVGWYVRIDDGRTFGPVSKRELDQWYAEGRISPTSTILPQDSDQWVKAVEIYRLLGRRSSPAPTPATRLPDGTENPFRDAPVTHAAAGSRRPGSVYLRPHRGGLILTLGILGFCCFVTGILAIIMGHEDLKLIRERRIDASGEGLTRAGFILGIVSTALNCLYWVVRVANA